MKRIAIGLILALGLTGCAFNSGTQTVNNFDNYTRLKPGESHKADIYGLFGQAHDVQYDSATGESVWSYYNMRATTSTATYIPVVGLFAGGSNVSSAKADFYFDNQGAFIRSERSEKATYKNMWAGMAAAVQGTSEIVARVKAEQTKLALPYDEKAAKKAAGAFTQNR